MARGFSHAPGASAEMRSALSPELDRGRLAELGQAKNWMVREAIGGREDCPLGVLVALAHDPHWEVRAAVAANPVIARTIMEHLARDRHHDVLAALLSNPSTAADIVESLAFHKRQEVRAIAGSRLNSVAMPPRREREDHATPELAERVVSMDTGAVYDIATGRPVVVAMAADTEGGDEESSPGLPITTGLTRTAPVRGFKISEVS